MPQTMAQRLSIGFISTLLDVFGSARLSSSVALTPVAPMHTVRPSGWEGVSMVAHPFRHLVRHFEDSFASRFKHDENQG